MFDGVRYRSMYHGDLNALNNFYENILKCILVHNKCDLVVRGHIVCIWNFNTVFPNQWFSCIDNTLNINKKRERHTHTERERCGVGGETLNRQQNTRRRWVDVSNKQLTDNKTKQYIPHF